MPDYDHVKFIPGWAEKFFFWAWVALFVFVVITSAVFLFWTSWAATHKDFFQLTIVSTLLPLLSAILTAAVAYLVAPKLFPK
jgi:hypothetical protein